MGDPPRRDALGVVKGAPGGREGVIELQRARLTGSMTELVRERGASSVTVAHVVARSGVSRRTFYELFEDREVCFLAAFERALAGAGDRTLPAYATPGSWNERMRAGLEALLGFFDDEPAMGFLCVVGALGAGVRALERRAEVIAGLVDAVHEGRREARTGRRINRLVAEGVVGAVLAVLHTRLQERDGRPLLALLNPLMGVVVLPYLGPAAAERELARAVPRARRPAQSRRDPLRDLQMRLTYRTVRVLLVIATSPAASNRAVATAAGVADQGQISKLLARLHTLGLVENSGGDHAKGEPNAWSLTDKGWEVAKILDTQPAEA